MFQYSDRIAHDVNDDDYKYLSEREQRQMIVDDLEVIKKTLQEMNERQRAKDSGFEDPCSFMVIE